MDSVRLAESEILRSHVFADNREGQQIRKKDERARREKQTPRRLDIEDELDQVALQMCANNYRNGHPTLLFVHSRRRTVDLAVALANLVPYCPDMDKKAVQQAKDCEKGQLSFCISRGVGFHNAQVEKKHRQLVERLFRSGELLVVVCTATLAWGVNLPSQTVIIRGTDVFTDTGRQDLDILDVKQIFGRAGRPQFTASGEVGRGVILTTHDRLGYYMRLLNGETALESFLGSALSDVLNSEIVLGNISTVGDALSYIKRTFYNIRVVNTQEQVIWSLARLQATRLVYCDKTVTNDPDLTLTPTELGQICSYYYINFESLTSFIACLKETAIGCQVDY